MEKVSVSEYRDATSHLNRLEANYHACVGVSEKFYWLESADRVLRGYLDIECSRAKEDDRIDFKNAANRVINRIERVSEAVKDLVDEAIADGFLKIKERQDIILATISDVTQRIEGNRAKLESNMNNARKKIKHRI